MIAALLGFLFGYYQAYPAAHAKNRAMLRLRLSEARARTLDAQVALVRANYGDAKTHLAEAIRLTEALKTADERNLPSTEVAKVDQALQGLRDAVVQVPGTQARADGAGVTGPDQASAGTERAANLLGEVYRATPEP